MILEFGQFRGRKLSDLFVPITYIRWLAERGSYHLPGNRFETSWKVPIVVCIAARREMERRGWAHDGSKWVREEE